MFTLIDLYNYKRRRGRYGERATGTYMTVGFLDKVPKDTVDMLVPGDVIFTQRLNSMVSWAIMHFSSSEIDHAALYIGSGRVLHMTLEGARVHSIDALAVGARVLPIRFAPSDGDVPADPPPDGERELYKPKFPISKLPNKLQFCWGAVRIIAGFHPERFNWRFIVDLVALGVLIDSVLIWIVGFPVGASVTAAFLILNLFNRLRFRIRKRRGKLIRYISHPDLGYMGFSRVGGIMFSNLGPLVLVDFGILPIGAFLALSREGPDDGTPDELKEFRESARDIAKRWGWVPGIQPSKNK
jgi:hypothetical protein